MEPWNANIVTNQTAYVLDLSRRLQDHREGPRLQYLLAHAA
jgi:hypothetical protein